MKKRILIMLISFITVPLAACPTCVGRVGKGSPPFFSEQFYQPNNTSMDAVYERLIREKSHAAAHDITTQPSKKQISEHKDRS